MAQKQQLRRDGRLLAHSLSFNPEHITNDMPPALQELLRNYHWKPRYAERTRGKAVKPLLKSVRHQSDPFNRSCPYYIDEKGKQSAERCLTGCVATCLEQVMSYYRYPEVLLDTLHGWETEHYKVESIMPGTRINWINILDDYRQAYTDEQAQAISDLSLYCGMAVHMNYTPSSSGASLGRACEALFRVFGYKSVAYMYRGLYTTPQWNRMLRHELENGRPICYTGHNISLGGHAFNIDGVDEEGYYHLNWGYGGDFDGYFDLDYLNPFENYADPTPMGMQEGLFANQTAMFLYPDVVDIEISDSLSHEDAFKGVTVDNIHFRRPPDNQGYTIADFTMTNHTQDSLNFTFEVLTFLPTDTAIFMQADYVALSAVNLAPKEQREWPVYCQFSEVGDRIFSFSADDETLPFQIPVTIAKGTSPVLKFGDVSCQLLCYGDNLVADFSLDITNEAQSGYAGNLITYCLFPENEVEDQRHWDILSLSAGSTQRVNTRFQHLEDGTTYTFMLRCPWEVRCEYKFKVCFSDATDGIAKSKETNEIHEIFDLAGRKVERPMHGIYIRNGKKTIFP